MSGTLTGESQWPEANWWLRLELSKAFCLYVWHLPGMIWRLSYHWYDMIVFQLAWSANWKHLYVVFPCALAFSHHRSLSVVGLFTWYLRGQSEVFQWTRRELHCLSWLDLGSYSLSFLMYSTGQSSYPLLPLKERGIQLHLLKEMSQGLIVETMWNRRYYCNHLCKILSTVDWFSELELLEN